MPSYSDQNFRLRAADGQEYVLKIANAEIGEEILRGQVAILDHLGERGRRNGIELDVPRVVRRQDGGCLGEVGGKGGASHYAWLVTWLSGTPLAEIKARTPELLRHFGRALGHLDRRLEGFTHPAARRFLDWDLRHAPRLLPHVESIETPERQRLVRGYLERFERESLPALRSTRTQVIHNDANDHNVLVSGPIGGTLRVSGLLDFGDMVETHLPCEPAVALTYLMLDTATPVSVARAFLSGYQSALPLSESEARLLPDLIQARLCLSVTMSARVQARDPDNIYLTVSEAPAWRLLERLLSGGLSNLDGELVDACRAGAEPPSGPTPAARPDLEDEG